MSNQVFKRARYTTHSAALRAKDSPVRGALDRLLQVARQPLDCAGLLSICIGAAALFEVARKLLIDPSPEFLELQAKYRALAKACIDRFEAHGEADPQGSALAYKSSHPAWCAIATAGETDELAACPAGQALAVELCWSLAEAKPMAHKFAASARADLADMAFRDMGLHQVLALEWDDRPPAWIAQSKKALPLFIGRFEAAPPPTPTPKTFEEKAAAELAARAAFATYRRRAGIADTSSWTMGQFKAAHKYGVAAPFRSVLERRCLMWFVAMGGLFVQSLADIPLAAHAPQDWVMSFDPKSGWLSRDFGGLVPNAAMPRPGPFVASSYRVAIPAPEDVRTFMQELCSLNASARTIGDVLPALRQISARAAVFPCPAELAPTWARLTRTVGPLALGLGIDSLLVAVLVGDFGLTAKSKLHYCQVFPREIWKAARLLYKALGWDEPVPLAGRVAFGASIVSPVPHLRRLVADWVEDLERLRPPNHLSEPTQLLKFHNHYVRVLAARLGLWLSLRAATVLPLFAGIDENWDLVVDLDEKGSAGRSGGMPAVICDDMRAALRSYRIHCQALRNRLRTFGWHGPVIDWLDDLLLRRDVLLLCEIVGPNQVRAIGTTQVQELQGADALARDWGRKTGENFLRRSGALWADLDRHQRHEVKGQEQDTQVADGSEAEWARRLAPRLNSMSRALHKVPLFGLRSTGAQA